MTTWQAWDEEHHWSPEKTAEVAERLAALRKPCGCACSSGGWCGGCGHAGCGGRRAKNLEVSRPDRSGFLEPGDVAELRAFAPIGFLLGALQAVGTLVQASLFPGSGVYQVALTPAASWGAVVMACVCLVGAGVAADLNLRRGIG
jgi:hypothetical protein